MEIFGRQKESKRIGWHTQCTLSGSITFEEQELMSQKSLRFERFSVLCFGFAWGVVFAHKFPLSGFIAAVVAFLLAIVFEIISWRIRKREKEEAIHHPN